MRDTIETCNYRAEKLMKAMIADYRLNKLMRSDIKQERIEKLEAMIANLRHGRLTYSESLRLALID